MSNLSQIRRAEMLEYLNHLKEIHTDDESRIALGKIETALTEKNMGYDEDLEIVLIPELLEQIFWWRNRILTKF